MFGSLQIYPPPPKANIAYKCLYRVFQISSTNNTLDSIIFLWWFLFCLPKQWQRNHVMLLAEQNKSHMWIQRYPKILLQENISFSAIIEIKNIVWLSDMTRHWKRVFSGLFTWVFGLARGFQLPSNMTWVYREGTYLQGKAGIPQIFGWTAMIRNIWRFHNRFQFAWIIFIIEQDDVYKFYVG